MPGVEPGTNPVEMRGVEPGTNPVDIPNWFYLEYTGEVGHEFRLPRATQLVLCFARSDRAQRSQRITDSPAISRLDLGQDSCASLTA